MIELTESRLLGKRAVARTLLLALVFFVILHPAALLGVVWTVSTVTDPQTLWGATPAAWIVGAVACLALAIWSARASRFHRVRVIAFVVLEGLFLGGFVTYFESVFPGVMMQLSFAAFSAIVGALVVLSTERVRSASLITRVVLVTAAGYVVFVLHNVGFSDMGLPIQTAWGAGSIPVFGVPLGLILGLLLIPLACYALVQRVDRVRSAAAEGVEPSYVWDSALGIMITIIWPWQKTPRELLKQRS